MDKNKKIVIIISFIISLILIVFLLFKFNLNNANDSDGSTNNNKIDSGEVTLSTYAFTIGDNSTELSIKIDNLKDQDISIEEISIILYDANDEVIKSINEDISTTVKSKENKIINVTLEERFVNVSDIKYEILK